jgi:hypothetical protein
VQSQALTGAANGGRIEIGALQKNIDRIGANFGIFAAHDAGQGDGALSIADGQITTIENALLAVQGDEFLTLAGVLDDNAPFAQKLKIKGMQGVSQLHEDIIGDIDNIVDGTQPHRLQAPSYPLRRRADIDAANQTCSIAWTHPRLLDGDRRLLIDGTARFCQRYLGETELGSAQCGHLSCNADQAQAISAIGGQTQLKARILEIESRKKPACPAQGPKEES